ncbi:restriction endonuclease subunit S [Microcoleus sp. Pol10D4]|uniref:restriction endonuclease subunit S n=1 Tax=Microcoleus sp. Pol10D4 TaxID=3055387 RepID=UPI002FD750F3
MRDWEETTLGELIDIKHGYAFKGEFFTEVPNGNALLTPGNFHIGGGFKADKFKYYIGDIPEDYVLSPGDVIVTMTDLSKDGDTLGYSARVPESTNRFLHNQRLGLVSTISKKADVNFIYWLLRTSPYQKTIVNSCSGSTVKHTSPSKIKDYKFLLPPITEQVAIDEVLSSFERKIKNLRGQNETLEAIAQTLFKHWFVDFEFPNEDGKPYKSSGGAMVRSELGEIPAGWRVGNMKECLEHLIDNRGKTPEFFDHGVPALSAKFVKRGDIVNRYSFNYVSQELFEQSEKLEMGDVILTSEAPLGEIYFIAKETCYYPAQRVFALRANKEVIPCSYLNYWLSSQMGQFQLRRRASGSTVQGIKQSELYQCEVIIPDKEIQGLVSDVFMKTLVKRETNSQQIQTLSQTRDLLLPRLMSGKIRVESKVKDR